MSHPSPSCRQGKGSCGCGTAAPGCSRPISHSSSLTKRASGGMMWSICTPHQTNTAVTRQPPESCLTARAAHSAKHQQLYSWCCAKWHAQPLLLFTMMGPCLVFCCHLMGDAADSHNTIHNCPASHGITSAKPPAQDILQRDHALGECSTPECRPDHTLLTAAPQWPS